MVWDQIFVPTNASTIKAKEIVTPNNILLRFFHRSKRPPSVEECCCHQVRPASLRIPKAKIGPLKRSKSIHRERDMRSIPDITNWLPRIHSHKANGRHLLGTERSRGQGNESRTIRLPVTSKAAPHSGGDSGRQKCRIGDQNENESAAEFGGSGSRESPCWRVPANT